jgi:hypothetical protein
MGFKKQRTIKIQISCLNFVPRLTEDGSTTLPILRKIIPYTTIRRNALNPNARPVWI